MYATFALIYRTARHGVGAFVQEDIPDGAVLYDYEAPDAPRCGVQRGSQQPL